MGEKNYGIMKSVQVSGDDAIINGIFPEGMPFEQRMKEYDRAVNKSIELIKERYRGMPFYKK
jgi:hypothetical protein